MTNEDRIRAAREEMEAVELHDARLDAITWLPAGDVLFQFNHVDTYHTDSSGRREVWSSTGALRFVGVTSLNIDGTLDQQADSIFDDAFFDSDGGEVQLGFAVGTVARVARVEIRFGFGAEIRMACTGVVWDRLDPAHKLEDWVD